MNGYCQQENMKFIVVKMRCKCDEKKYVAVALHAVVQKINRRMPKTARRNQKPAPL